MENREIPKGWRETTLGEVAIKITKGTTPSTIGSNFTDTGINFFRSECVKENKYLDKSLLKYIDEETHLRMKRSQLEENDILFSMAGMFLGKTGIVKKQDIPGNINQAVAIIRLNNEMADFNFVYYFLNNKEVVAYVNNSSGQSAQPNINLQQIGEIKLLIPSTYEEQVAIGQVLSSLDEKIELLEEENKTLETLAQTIFTEWFVNFNFPGATGEMEDSELGEIPKGWRVGKLGEIVDFINGYAFKSSELDTSNALPSYAVFKMGNIRKGGGINKDKIKDYVLKEKCEKLEKYVLKSGDILMCMTDMKDSTALLGHTALMDEDNKFIVNQRVGLMRCLNSKNVYWFYILSNHESFITNLRKKANSGVQINLSSSTIVESSIIIPNDSILTLFSDISFSMFEKIRCNSQQIQTLKTSRDTLLPKLTTGEIRVEGFGE